jgi:hypothetical protein
VGEVADAPAQPPHVPRELAAEDGGAAAARAKEPGEDPQQGRLPGAVRAEHRERSAGRELDLDPLEGGAIAVVASEVMQRDCGGFRAHAANLASRVSVS